MSGGVGFGVDCDMTTVGKGGMAVTVRCSLEGLLDRLILAGVSLVDTVNEDASRGLLLTPVSAAVTGVAVAVIVEVSVVEVVVDRSSSSANSRVDSGSRKAAEMEIKSVSDFNSPIESKKGG